MRRIFVNGGLAASLILIALGIGSIVVGLSGRGEVRDTIAEEQIVGTPDSEIPGEEVDTGDEARKFADVIRKHTLEATGGKTYSEMPRFVDAKGNPTEDEAQAAKDPETGEPVANGERQIWITSTALSTALNTSYFAESVATFSVAMGIALLLTGIGFLVLNLGTLARR